MNGAELVLRYIGGLDTESTPDTGAYAVHLDGAAGPAVSGVAVSDTAVTLTLDAAVRASHTVTVSYSPESTTDPLRDASGIEARALTDQAVTNATVASTGATLSALSLARHRRHLGRARAKPSPRTRTPTRRRWGTRCRG